MTNKKAYSVPTVNVISIKSEGILCFSTGGSSNVMWYYDGSLFSSDQKWTRNGYGDAEVI